jgi:hypothetical protein
MSATNTPAPQSPESPAPPNVTTQNLPPRTRKRPRWWLRALIAVLIVGLLAGAAELALRALVPNIVANSIRDGFQLPADHPVDVELHGLQLIPALSGRVGPVELWVQDIEVVDGIEASLHASAESMPFDPSRAELEGARASVSVPSSSLGEVVSLATNGLVDIGRVEGDEVVVGTELSLFGFDVPLTARLALSVQDGQLLVEPTGVKVTGFDFTAQELRDLTGGAIGELLHPHVVCVSDRLPQGITLTQLSIQDAWVASGATLTLGASLAPDLLSNPEQFELGSCENTPQLDLIG